MGYMGFGMRKEVYTRKPKKAFIKLKKIYGKHVDLPKSTVKTDVSSPTSFERHAYKPFNQTLPYLIFIRTLVLFLLGSALWFGFLQDPFMHYRREQFEKNAFVQFYNSELTGYKRIFSFLESKTDRVVRASFSPRYNDFEVRIRCPRITDSTSRKDIRYTSFDGRKRKIRQQNKAEIINGTLTIEKENFLIKTYQNNWIYTLRNVIPSQIPQSISNYIDGDNEKFLRFLDDVRTTNSTINVQLDSMHMYYHDERFGRYSIVHMNQRPEAKSKMSEGYTYNTIVGKLDENVYWTRIEKVRGSKK